MWWIAALRAARKKWWFIFCGGCSYYTMKRSGMVELRIKRRLPGLADYCLTKGVVLALDVLLIGFKVGHGNSPFLNNSAGRQHSLLSPLTTALDCRAGLSTAARMRRSS